MIETNIQGFRLSPQQRRLWPQLQIGGSSPFWVRCQVAIKGELDCQALQAAFRQAVERHEILRTNFRSLSAMAVPLQVIREDLRPELELLQSEAEAGPQEPNFDAAQGSPIRACLESLGPQRHRLTLSLSALCSDGVGLANLVGEIGRCYQAAVTGDGLGDDAPLQYADLSEWQNELLESEETEAGREYWREKDYSPSLSASLPFENPKPASPRFSLQSVAVDPGAEPIGELCRRYGCSAEILLLSCWHLLLWRWSGERNRVIACAFEGRKYQELAEALGLFCRYLPVECELSAGQTMQDLVQQVEQAWQQTGQWQETFAWEQVVNGDSSPDKDGLFFPWSFDFASAPQSELFAGVSFQVERLQQVSDRFKLRFSCTAGEGQAMQAEILYDKSLFRQADVKRLAGQLEALLDCLLQSPEAALGQASLLSDSERQELLTNYNQARADLPARQCLDQLIEEQASLTPNRVALVYEGQQLSYEEMERRSRQVAQFLLRQGVGPDVPVALCMERSHRVVLAMTGILKAGGAYVPIDPAQPPQRMALMLEEAGAALVLADEELTVQGKARLVLFDDLQAEPMPEAPAALSRTEPGNLAYILFTSGSSGRPKPVGVEHRQAVNYLQGVRRKLELPLPASYATVTTLAADLGNTMIFPSLCGGGCLHIVSQQRVLDADLLAEYLEEEQVDCLKIVPSHLQALLRARRASKRPPLPLQRLVVGGEALGAGLAELLLSLSTSCRIDNHYGPTETTVGVLTCRLKASSDAWGSLSSVPLGTPIENVQVYALDRGLGPVPSWVAGEIHIGGAAVARGYIGQPGRTAQSFIPDPFAERPGSRLYKTGDLARHWPGAGLEFLGRADAQVKIRGYRIELGEIESALQRHPAVAEAALLIRTNTQGQPRLVAYLVAADGQELQTDELRTHLSDWLPDYMLPASFVSLASLPLTPNGKLDRRALPDDEPPGTSQRFVAPQTPSQELLASIWCAILDLERVGAEDNFFDLGGHSLLATQMLSRIRQAFQVELPLRTIFEAPTLSAAAQRIDEARLQQKGQTVPTIRPVARQGPLPLSFAQQRLWFLDHLQPGSALYNLPLALRMEGQLDAWALQASISEVVRRHEILRSSFPAVEGRAEQLIRPAQPWILARIDLTGIESVRDAELARLIREEALRPFDLADGPLLRTFLVELAHNDHALLATMHHIVSDRWSMGVLVEEITRLYEAFKARRPSPLDELAIQYADFACWQRDWLQGEVLESQMAYWTEQLGDSPAELSLPADRPRPRQPSHRGAVHVFLLHQPLADALQRSSRAADATLFMTLLAAFQTLLGRYGGQSDVSVGTPVANRNRAETEPLIGFFVNTLVLRTDLSGDPAFRELVARVREVTLGAYEHQDIPFEQLVEALQPERSLSRTPLFQVMFALQNAPGKPRSLSGLRTSRLAVETHTAKFDLTLTLREHVQGMLGVAEYSTDLFDSSTVRRLMGHFRNLLQGAADDPSAPLSSLPLSSAAELHQMALEWNASHLRLGAPASLQERFEEQVRVAPQAVALVFEEALVSYGELNRRSRRLAQMMRRRGVGLETLAAICLEPSLEMATAVLAVVQAGAAYLPLDPAYPAQRLSYLLEDARPSLVLTEGRFAEGLEGSGAEVLCWNRSEGDGGISRRGAEAQREAEEAEENAAVGGASLPTAFAESAAYLIYTSGSTGQPKGVLVSHGNALRLFDATRHWFGFDANEVWTLFHSYTFDFSVWELWGALLYGGRLVTVPVLKRRSPDEFCQLLRRQQVTVLNQTPSAFRQLVAADQRSASAAASLKWVIFGGEALQIESLRPWWDRYGDSKPRLVNMYGITETTVHVTYRPLSRSDLGLAPGGFIGVPIPDLQVYLLDGRLDPVPMGALGEMYVGGSGPARGYRGHPALTSQRFVPDPFSPQPGGRLYRTGDLARFCQGRDLEYMGRIDHQVKIRGFRIELGEIEAALSRHPAVAEAVALAREDRPGLKRLVAYWVARAQEEKAETAELRQFLAQKLPEYMVPAAFVRLDALPLTSNGKIDRKALPAPERARPEMERAYVAPRSSTEARLAQIWGEVLGLERVGVEDNFFELGGDSILSIQVIARAGQAGLRLTVNQVFEHQTVAELAAVAGTAAAVVAEQGPVVGDVPVTPVQRWFLERDLAEPHHFNQSVLLEVEQGLDAAILERALSQLAVHHDALRLSFFQEGSVWRQVNQQVGSQSGTFCRLDLSSLNEQQQRQAVAQAGGWLQASLDLHAGKLWRSLSFDLGGGRPSALLIVVHHLAVDGVSWRILLEDLEALCRQLQQGAKPQLPPKTSSFRQWAERLQEYAGSDALDSEAPHWMGLSQLSRKPLPLDHPGGDNSDASARSLSRRLSEDQTQRLLREAPKAYNTRIEDLLLTALAQCLGRWTGSDSLLVTLEGHGREGLFDELDLSRTVGWFTSLYPLALDLRGTSGSAAALKAVKEQLRAVPQRGIGFGVLRYLGPETPLAEQLSHMPAAEVSFNYLGQFGAAAREAALFKLAPASIGPQRSPRSQRAHLLDVSGRISAGQLHMSWTYSRNLHRSATIERLADDFMTALERLVDHCCSPQAGGYTPSDFPLARLDQRQLDSLLGQDRQVEDLYPLSPLQHGLLFHSLYRPRQGEYVIQTTCRLDSRVDFKLLRQAWDLLSQRHPILRTSFLWKGLKEPLQVVRPQAKPEWQEEDWSEVPASAHPQRFASWLEEDRRRGFDLSRAPLMRLSLIRLSQNAYQMVWTFHHLLLDGWAKYSLLKEFFAVYAALAEKRRADLPRIPPYRDYIGWLQAQDAAQARVHWRERLGGFEQPTSLGIDRRPAVADGEERYLQQTFRLAPEMTERLQALARRQHLTLNTLVQGAWGLLLSRYSGQADVVFGVTVAGRPPEIEGIESMIGSFINTLPLRCRIDPSAGLLSWLEGLQQQQVEMRRFEYSSLAEVQSCTDVPSEQRLFASVLAYQNYPLDESLQGSSRDLSLGDVQTLEKTDYPLSLVAWTGRSLFVRIVFSADRFKEADIRRMQGHLRTILQAMAQGLERRLGDVPLLSAAQRHQLLREWNDSARAGSASATVLPLFARQTEIRPHALALIADGQGISFAELERRSNQLARYLRDMGAGADMPVGLCLERCPEMILAMLGILKAGAAYLPLDPAYPLERLSFLLEDASAAFVLTEERIAETLPSFGTWSICLDRDAPLIDSQPDGPLSRQPLPENLAYLIYTSGTTGAPKGVAVSHRGLPNLARVQIKDFAIQPASRVLQFAPVSFDASVSEFFMTLLSGAALFLGSKESLMPGPGLLRLLRQEAITKVTVPPSVLASLEEAALPALETIVVAGEACPAGLIPLWAKGRRFVNAYGPSEATVCATISRPLRREEELCIGRPIANARVVLIDGWGRLAPSGVAGELCIGGTGLARGYWNRPGLTAERFVPDACSGQAGSRLYRTGDLARLSWSGEIEFAGRIDHQIKVRGFRIEPAEVESVLCQHPEVREAVAVTAGEQLRQQRLVAYLAIRQGASLSAAEVQEFAASRLPAHMIPSSLVFLDELPRTRSGKVDRQALPSADGSKARGRYRAPESATQDLLAGIWSEVLGVSRVGLSDDFFELGGHSLLATQVVSRIAQVLDVEVDLQELFDAPSLEGFAQRVDQALLSGQGAAARPPLTAQPRQGEQPLSFAQQRLWFLQRLDPTSSLYNIPTALLLEGDLDLEAFTASVNEVIRRHEALRTSFPAPGGTPVQKVQDWQPRRYPLLDLQALPEEARIAELQRLAKREAAQPFDLSAGDLLRVRIARLSPQRHGLLATMHHIVSDGWSVGVLVRELSALYGSFAAGQPSPLPELPLQYADFAAWQRSWLKGEALDRQLDYWRQHLDGAPPQIDLPTDRPRPARLSYRGATRSFSLDSPLSESLKELCRREHATLFMTLLAAFKVLLQRSSGQSDISVGTTIANRNQSETEGLIGFFNNTLALRSDLSGQPSFTELVARVRRTALGAYAHQDIPFEEVVEALQPERSLSRAPLFQVAFSVQNAPGSVLELPGLKAYRLQREGQLSKFDLTLFMGENREGLISGSLEYSRDLFDAATIKRMIGHLSSLLESAAAQPEQKLWQLTMLPEAERLQLLVEWNDREREYPRQALIHQLLDEQASLRPDACAIAFRDAQLSYAELSRRSDQMASRLADKGAGPERLVGLLSERTPEAMIGLVAIFKSGAAYLPLDPAYPPERLAYMVEDSAASLLLVRDGIQEMLPESAPQALSLSQSLDQAPEAAPPHPANLGLDSLAYLIYTSGTTGQPKGVAVSHGGICNLAQAQIRAFDIRRDSRVLQFAALSFDASISEVAMAWLSGATLCLEAQQDLLPSPRLAALLQERAITAVTFPPSLLAFLPPAELPALRTIIVAGEACSAEVASEWAPGRRFVNAYGPTEATVCSTMARFTQRGEAPPIGRPIENSQIFILDGDGLPAPIGVAGELHSTGPGLARGYLNRPAQTAQRFVPNPFSAKPGQRLYRSGDLARWRRDGNIDFLGRADQQVKVRGVRIELQEVEAVLRQSPLLQEAAAVLRKGGPQGDSLTAFIVAKPQAEAPLEPSASIELWPSVAEYFVYDELLYFAMTHDELRNEAYRKAIRQLVKDKLVVDLGTGQDAILARLCIEEGAKKVYAVELLDESYRKAAQRLQELGLEDRICLIQGNSTRIELPERVDVCVSELVGPIGGAEGVVPILNDARQRFLKPGGAMIPQRSLTKIAAVRLPEEFWSDPGFSQVSGHYAEQIFQQVGRRFDFRLCIKNLPDSNLISSSGVFEDLDFGSEMPASESHQIRLEIEQDSRCDGFWVWLNLHTIEGVEIDIQKDVHCWLPVFLPVFYPGIEVCRGDVIEAACTRSPCENGFNLDYRLQGQVLRRQGDAVDFDYCSRHFADSYGGTPFHKAVFKEESVKVVDDPTAGQPDLVQQLRRFLRTKLPEHMVPSRFVPLERLPLTPSNKVDRKALLEGASDQAQRTYRPPTTAIEEQVAAIWADVLGVEQVGLDDNFFDLGGHSLLLARVQARLQEQMGIEVPVVELFKWPTVASLAEYLEGGGEKEIRLQDEAQRGEKRKTAIQRRQRRRRQIRQELESAP